MLLIGNDVGMQKNQSEPWGNSSQGGAEAIRLMN